METKNGAAKIAMPETEKKLKYPKSVFFILSNEFCERFSYYGMRTILALYLQFGLKYSKEDSIAIYHVFVMLCYFTPFFGGIIADSWLGKFNTILYISILYAVGNIILSIGSITILNIPHSAFSLVGLFLIAMGTGGIKPCVSSFGGDQFVLPQQEKQLQRFFSVFYFSINAGSVISSFLSPEIRENVQCLGEETCYPLAFGIPAILMIVSVVLFAIGKPMYKIKAPEGNVTVEVSKCIGRAIANKVKHQKTQKKDHWLDYAGDKYSKKLISETKILIKLTVLFLPTIVFWALYEQQGSKWTYQANRMDGNLFGFVIEPDQMQVVNPILVLIFIPVFEHFIYPLLSKLRLVRTPLQKLSWGGMLAAIAFVLTALVELKIEQYDPVLPSHGHAELRLYNGMDCKLGATLLSSNTTAEAHPFRSLHFLDIPVPKDGQVKLNVGCTPFPPSEMPFDLKNHQVSSYIIIPEGSAPHPLPLSLYGREDLIKSEDGAAKIKVVYNLQTDSTLHLTSGSEKYAFFLPSSVNGTSAHQTKEQKVKAGKYKVHTEEGLPMADLEVKPGGVSALFLDEKNQNYTSIILTPPNLVSMMWQLPQYFVITFAEIMFSITGIEFSYSESPESMKSIMSSIWLLTDSLGNLIVIFVEKLQIFESEAYVCLLFAALMAVVMVIFIFMAMSYKYSNPSTKTGTQENKEDRSLPTPPTSEHHL